MAFSNPIIEAGVVGLHGLFAARAVTPSEVTEAYLARIARLNPGLGAVLDLDQDGARRAALASAARWATGRSLSPLDGVPVLVKCNIAVAGLPWHGGIGAYRDRIADTDAACITHLRRAGTVILGTVNMHEGALGATTDNPWFGRCENPHKAGYTAGGSSGGSGSAVAAGLCAAALGTDTMGSVRIPSAYCGIFGHKPTFDLIPTQGVIPLSWTLDHVGVHARSAQDCAALLAAASATELGSPTSGTIAALDLTDQVEIDAEVAQAFAETLDRARALGLEVRSLRLANYDCGRMRRLGLLISESEGYVVHEAALSANPDGFSESFRNMLTWGAAQPASKLDLAYREIVQTAQSLRAAFSPYSAILAPTAPQSAFPFEPVPANQADITAIANLTSQPACAFPVGVTSAGLPLSVQAISGTDAGALYVAQILATSAPTPAGFGG